MSDTFDAEVADVVRLGPRVVRIVLAGGTLAGYEPVAAPDESVCLWVPGAGEGRNYTVRAYETGRMTVDFVLHPGGLAGTWAAHAERGERLTVTRPRSWYRPTEDAAWVLAAADLTGLPALARLVTERPPGAPPVHAFLETVDDADLAAFPGDLPDDVRLTVLRGAGNGVAPSRLAEQVEGFLADAPAGPGYVWVAGEASETRAVRKHLRSGLGWELRRVCTVGYWRREAERWNQAYEKVGGRLEAYYQEVLEQGRSDDEASELYDLELERAGL